MKQISIFFLSLVLITSCQREDLQTISKEILSKELTEVQADSGLVILIKNNEIAAKVNLISKNKKYTDGGTDVFNQPRYIGGLIYPFPMMIALKENLLNLSDTVDVGNGSYIYKGARMVDHNHDKGGYGVITAKQVFGYNSNIGMAKLMLKGYEDNQMEFASSMIGLGFPIDTVNWNSIALPWLSIGYETKVSPIKLIHLYKDIAHNKINGYEKVIPDIQDLMRFCVESGTGKYIDSDDTEIAGKTSTTITSEGKEVSFCGYFTLDNSVYTCLVIISNPKKGYPSGGMMAGNVVKGIINLLNKE